MLTLEAEPDELTGLEPGEGELDELCARADTTGHRSTRRGWGRTIVCYCAGAGDRRVERISSSTVKGVGRSNRAVGYFRDNKMNVTVKVMWSCQCERSLVAVVGGGGKRADVAERRSLLAAPNSATTTTSTVLATASRARIFLHRPPILAGELTKHSDVV